VIPRQRDPVHGGAFKERIHRLRDSELCQVAGLLVCFPKVLQFNESGDAFVVAVEARHPSGLWPGMPRTRRQSND